MVAATGRPYDTLEGVIGIGNAGKGCGTLREFGVNYDEVAAAAGLYARPMTCIAREVPRPRQMCAHSAQPRLHPAQPAL